MKLLILLLTLIAAGAGVAAVSGSPALAPAERQAAAAPIDFEALHQEASAALENLRQSHERRITLATSAAF
jgi:hypothetical protein